MAKPHSTESSANDAAPLPPRKRPRHRRLAIALTLAVAVLVVTGVLVFSGRKDEPHLPITTPWRAASPLFVAGRGGTDHHKSGTWTLVDDVLSGRWGQSASGPPPGFLACPSASTCYVMSGHYASPDANAPLLSESLYVSTDVGSTWSVLPLPAGFDPTSPIACSGATDCAAGGTYQGKPVLVATRNGGHSFVITPLPAADGNLYSLSCPSASFCAGLVAQSADATSTPTDATFLSTSDGGSTFFDAPILARDSMQSLTCSSSLDCTAVGTSDALRNDLTAGVVARTTDGGHTWVAGALPAGFGIDYLSQLSCADALHCSVTGTIAITVANSPQCASIPKSQSGMTGTTTTPTTTVQSPAVQSISQVESRAAAEAAQSTTNSFTCNPGDQSIISDVASTDDGGLTWTPDPLPADVPQPGITGLSCPTDNECWAAGSDAVPEQVGNTSNGGSSVLLGTTDGGLTWSKVTFSVPQSAPNYEGQSYLSIGSIDCPSAQACVALGAAAQSSPSAPVYSLVVPGPSS